MAPQEQQLIDNPLFLKWVFRNNPAVESYWEQYFNEHPAERKRVLAFKTSLSNFKIADDILTAEEKIQMSSSILSQINRELLKKRRLTVFRSLLRYAAIIAVAFIAGNLLKPSAAPIDKETRYSEIFVPFGQMSQLTLSDGTKVWLNSGTTLRYPERFAENKRSVSIEGEAYFEVAKMPDRPFTVNAADIKVEVLGTSFNLSTYEEDATTSVTLVKGKVNIQNTEGKNIAHLSPGQKATKDKTKNTLQIQDVKTSFYSSWTKGKISFDDEPLDQIVAKLERWFNVEILFADERLKSIRFTGTILKNKPVDQIMQALALLAPIRFKHQINANEKDKITIYKRT